MGHRNTLPGDAVNGLITSVIYGWRNGVQGQFGRQHFRAADVRFGSKADLKA
jgi:hypothetical protein